MAAVPNQGAHAFHYEALSNPRRIRLLKLLPASSRSEDITCTIDKACLDDDVQYEALSYTWGDATQRSELHSNGEVLSITCNLDTALRHLRHSLAPRILWVDAVCINQSDTEERNQQVALMRDVFTKASQVIAWLGEEHPSDSAAMEFGDLKPLPVNSPEKDKILKLAALQAQLPSSLMAARLLVQRPWFGRAWIIQEAALARRLQVQCGQKVIDWESLHGNLRLLDSMNDASGARVSFNNPFYQRLGFIEATRSSIKTDRSRHLNHRPLTTGENMLTRRSAWKQIHSAVINARSYGATDQRDHIYALLGLINADGAPFPVDYSLPYTKVFRNFARFVIQETDSLSGLGQVDSSATASLESWVPDYSRVSMVDSLSSDDEAFYTASGDSGIRLLDPQDAPVFALSGIFFDDVDEVAMGPSTNKEKVFSHREKIMFKAVDKVNPTELLPKLAYRAISHISPQAKEAIDRIIEVVQLPKDTGDQAADQRVLGDRERHHKQMLEMWADISKVEKKNDENITSFAFAIAILSLRQSWQSHLFGPMDSSSGVYMKPALEEQWQRLALKCGPYTTGEELEDVYWRTLIGNRRNGHAGNVDKPPQFWRDAYNIWHGILWEKEGVVPRFLRGGGLNFKGGMSSPRGKSAVKNKGYETVSANLLTYLREAHAEQQKVSLDQQLGASAYRAILCAVISLSKEVQGDGANQGKSKSLVGKAPAAHAVTANVLASNQPAFGIAYRKKPQGFLPFSKEIIDQIAEGVQQYPDLGLHEQERLRELFSPSVDHIAANKERDEDMQAEIDQAFRYDFLRIARNRKFCITKKRYMGWCPFDTKPGDRVCILFGGQTPYVVRKQGNGYRLLGEAYLHGVMDGEVLGMPDIKIETIRLV
ncbi:MAG: hypothetical protein Q9208_002703 [Pyrenodesmia sp. 3 TL-2023]